MEMGDLAERSARIRWFHRMELAPGIVTEGIYDPTRTLARLGLPHDLSGRRVLDVGAWDGFYSFECERRGAAEVVATDDYSWGGDGWGTQDGFNLAREAFGSKVRDLRVDPVDLNTHQLGAPYDVVLLLGVLYHLRDPIRVLERVRAITGGLLILETEVGMLLTRRPSAEFFPGSELNLDPTNWWAPNVPAIKGMLHAVGFDDVRVQWHRRLPVRAAKWIGRLRSEHRLSMRRALTTDRFVFHARV